jgi:hypothetical protein
MSATSASSAQVPRQCRLRPSWEAVPGRVKTPIRDGFRDYGFEKRVQSADRLFHCKIGWIVLDSGFQ